MTTRPWPAWRWNARVIATVVVAIGFVVATPLGIRWVEYRLHHSITDDAFVESHLSNLSARVAGQITRLVVDERDVVPAGALLAQVDPIPFERQVDLARAKLAVSQATLAAEETALRRLVEEVPRQVVIAEQELAIAKDDETKALRFLELTTRDVEKQIAEAKAFVDSAAAVFTQTNEDYKRYSKLAQQKAVPERRFEEATRAFKTAKADVDATQAKLERALAAKMQVDIADQSRQSTSKRIVKASENLQLARLGNLRIAEAQRQVKVRAEQVEEARRELAVAQTTLDYTKVIAPAASVIVKRYRNLGDYAPVGSPILSLYNPELLYVTAYMEETRLTGIAPGAEVRLDIDAFDEPFRGRVLWIGKATAANFALIPRDVSAGEFTKVVQRVPIRIWIEKDERWPMLQAGLSVTVSIAHGPGDPQWAQKMSAREEALGDSPPDAKP